MSPLRVLLLKKPHAPLASRAMLEAIGILRATGVPCRVFLEQEVLRSERGWGDVEPFRHHASSVRVRVHDGWMMIAKGPEDSSAQHRRAGRQALVSILRFAFRADPALSWPLVRIQTLFLLK